MLYPAFPTLAAFIFTGPLLRPPVLPLPVSEDPHPCSTPPPRFSLSSSWGLRNLWQQRRSTAV